MYFFNTYNICVINIYIHIYSVIMKIYVLHENDDWVVPLRAELEKRGLPYEEWFLNDGTIDITTAPSSITA